MSFRDFLNIGAPTGHELCKKRMYHAGGRLAGSYNGSDGRDKVRAYCDDCSMVYERPPRRVEKYNTGK